MYATYASSLRSEISNVFPERMVPVEIIRTYKQNEKKWFEFPFLWFICLWVQNNCKYGKKCGKATLSVVFWFSTDRKENKQSNAVYYFPLPSLHFIRSSEFYLLIMLKWYRNVADARGYPSWTAVVNQLFFTCSDLFCIHQFEIRIVFYSASHLECNSNNTSLSKHFSD